MRRHRSGPSGASSRSPSRMGKRRPASMASHRIGTAMLFSRARHRPSAMPTSRPSLLGTHVGPMRASSAVPSCCASLASGASQRPSSPKSVLNSSSGRLTSMKSRRNTAGGRRCSGLGVAPACGARAPPSCLATRSTLEAPCPRGVGPYGLGVSAWLRRPRSLWVALGAARRGGSGCVARKGCSEECCIRRGALQLAGPPKRAEVSTSALPPSRPWPWSGATSGSTPRERPRRSDRLHGRVEACVRGHLAEEARHDGEEPGPVEDQRAELACDAVALDVLGGNGEGPQYVARLSSMRSSCTSSTTSWTAATGSSGGSGYHADAVIALVVEDDHPGRGASRASSLSRARPAGLAPVATLLCCVHGWERDGLGARAVAGFGSREPDRRLLDTRVPQAFGLTCVPEMEETASARARVVASEVARPCLGGRSRSANHSSVAPSPLAVKRAGPRRTVACRRARRARLRG